MSDERAASADRERQLAEELAEVQRLIRELFPVNTEPLDFTDPVRAKPLQREERKRLHARREEIRAELDALRAPHENGEA